MLCGMPTSFIVLAAEELFGHSVDWTLGVATLILAAFTCVLAVGTVYLAVLAKRAQQDSDAQLAVLRSQAGAAELQLEQLKAQGEISRAANELAKLSLAATYQPVLIEMPDLAQSIQLAVRDGTATVSMVLRNAGRGPAFVARSFLTRPNNGGWVGGSTPERTIAPGETVRVSFVDGNPELVEQVQALQPLQVVVEYQDVVREHTWSAQVLLAHRDAGWHARGGVKTKLGRTERTVSLGQAG
jgi:hypothetical protein